MITTAAMNEAAKNAWCRERGVFPADLDKWRASCATALADPEDARASPQATRADRKRIKELEPIPYLRPPRDRKSRACSVSGKTGLGQADKLCCSCFCTRATLMLDAAGLNHAFQ